MFLAFDEVGIGSCGAGFPSTPNRNGAGSQKLLCSGLGY